MKFYSGESPSRLETSLVLIVLDLFVIANCYLTEWRNQNKYFARKSPSNSTLSCVLQKAKPRKTRDKHARKVIFILGDFLF